MARHPTPSPRTSRVPTRPWVRAWRVLRTTVALLLVAGLLSQSSVSWAQGGRPPPARPTPSQQDAKPVTGKVDIQLMVVHGTDAHNRVDPDLKAIMKYLRYLPHKGYALLSSDDSALSVNSDHSFPVEGGRRVDVKLLSVDQKQAKIHIEFFQGKTRKMETTVAVNRNKSFMLSGPKHDNGELILAISARY